MKKREILGFSIGGVGHNLIYSLFSGYLLIFYTDVFGLSGSFTALLFLIARIFDALNDPVMGIIADSSHSRLGRYRVWLLRAAPVIAASLCLCFFVPETAKKLQYLYCYVTYILLGMSFTCADIPFWSLPSVMTADAAERTRLFSVGSVAACLASGAGAMLVPMIVKSAGSFAQGYLICAVLFSVIGIACYTLCAVLVRERVELVRSSYSLKSALRTVFRNRPLCILMAASLAGNLAFQVKVAINTYYGQYTLGNYGYVVYLSGMLLLGMVIGSALVPALLRRIGAKASMMAVLLAGVAISLVYYLSGYSSLALVLVFSALSAVVIGAFAVLVNTMTADAIDYAEVHIGQRNEGIITSTRTFVTKLATAAAGAAAALALDKIGYVRNAVQTLSVKNDFHMFMSLCAAVLYLIGFLIICRYPLNREKFAALQAALRERRQSHDAMRN
jgi:sugar (glycoside-pentoside-hexuronide) transporter